MTNSFPKMLKSEKPICHRRKSPLDWLRWLVAAILVALGVRRLFRCITRNSCQFRFLLLEPEWSQTIQICPPRFASISTRIVATQETPAPWFPAGTGPLIERHNDGRTDAVATTNDGQPHVLHQETPTDNHWLTLKHVGHKSNRDAIRAEVELVTGTVSQIYHCDYCKQLSLLPAIGKGTSRLGDGEGRADCQNSLAKRNLADPERCSV